MNVVGTGEAPLRFLAQVEETKRIDVVEIDGPIDVAQRDFLEDAFARAESGEIEALVFRVNSLGALGVDVMPLVQRARDLPVPVISWVGPAGARARGASLLFLAASDVVTATPKAVLGPFNPGDLKENEDLSPSEFEALLQEVLGTKDTEGVQAWSALLEDKMTAKSAHAAGLVSSLPPIVGQVIVGLDEQEIVMQDGSVRVLDTAQVVTGEDGQVGLEPTVITRFYRISYVPNFFHKINTPTFAYVMFMLGLAAVVFEFYAASIGLAGIMGAACLLISFVAMGALPVNWWAVVLLALSLLLFSIDVQVVNLGIFTMAGTVAAIVGSLFFTSVGIYQVRWWAIFLVVGGMVLFYTVVMTTIARTRFATPVIGRGNLVGLAGEAQTDIASEGLVSVDGAVWKARSHRGRIGQGERVTVRLIDGIVLEVDRDLAVAGD